MLAAVYSGRKSIQVKEVPMPELKDIQAPKKFGGGTIPLRKEDLVLLRVEAASICGTDLHTLTKEHGSAPPVILGHEYVGRVLEVGSAVTHIRESDFVAVDPNIKCGNCEYCRKGLPNMCVNLTTLGIFIDGGFAEYNVVPAKQLFRLPDDMPPDRAIFFEPVSCVMHGLGKVKPMAGENVLIFGGGPIGCYFTMLCLINGAATVTIEPNEFRRGFVEKLGGITLPSAEDLIDDYFDIVIDACGMPQIIPQTFQYAKRGGRVLLFGQQNINASVEINPTLANQKELQIFGSYATATSFENTIRVLSDSRLDFESLITHRIALENIAKAFKAMKEGNAMEVVINA